MLSLTFDINPGSPVFITNATLGLWLQLFRSILSRTSYNLILRGALLPLISSHLSAASASLMPGHSPSCTPFSRLQGGLSLRERDWDPDTKVSSLSPSLISFFVSFFLFPCFLPPRFLKLYRLLPFFFFYQKSNSGHFPSALAFMPLSCTPSWTSSFKR